MSDLSTTIARARMVREDCNTDAAALNSTPFTPKGIGETFGNTLAMIAAVAKCCEEIAETLAQEEA